MLVFQSVLSCECRNGDYMFLESYPTYKAQSLAALLFFDEMQNVNVKLISTCRLTSTAQNN